MERYLSGAIIDVYEKERGDPRIKRNSTVQEQFLHFVKTAYRMKIQNFRPRCLSIEQSAMPQKKQKTATLVCAMLLAVGFVMALLWYEHGAHLRRVRGAWEGTMRFHVGQNTAKQRIVLRVLQEKNGSYHAVVDQIDLGLTNLPATRFSAGWSSIVFESSSNFVFRGTLKAGATEITGRWSWPGRKRSQPLTLTRTQTPDVIQAPLALADYTPRTGSDLQGLWQGTLKTGSASLRLNFKIAESADGKYRGELNSIDQRPVIPVPATAVVYSKPRVTISFQGIGLVFDGTLDDSGAAISGKWTQGSSQPMTLARMDPAAGS